MKPFWRAYFSDRLVQPPTSHCRYVFLFPFCLDSYPLVNKHSKGKPPFLVGDRSSNGGLPIAMLVYRYRRVYQSSCAKKTTSLLLVLAALAMKTWITDMIETKTPRIAKVWFSYQGMLDSPKCMWRLLPFFKLYIYTCTYIGWGSNPGCNCSKLKIFKHASYVCLESFEPFFVTLKSSSSSRVILDVPGYSTPKRKLHNNQNFFWPSVLKNKHIYIVIFSHFLFAKKVKHWFFFVKKTTKKLNAAGI